MDTSNVEINGLVVDRVNYDVDGDVLYLARGETTESSDAALTPEGHGIRYDGEGHVIGVTTVNALWPLEALEPDYPGEVATRHRYRDDLGCRDDVIHAPAVGGADVHVFDEPQDVTGAAEMLGHLGEPVIVDAAFHHHVDLHRGEPRRGGRVDPGQHPSDRERDVVHRRERGIVERIKADGHTRQTSILQHPSLGGQCGIRWSSAQHP